jgi:DNA polymerase-3 subunit alpha
MSIAVSTIKGTGQQAIDAIVAAREGRGPTEEAGPFKSLFDFARRVDRSRLNKRCVEALIKAGAFDTIHLNRASLVESMDRAFDFAAASAANANQHGLFDMGGEDDHGSSTQEPDMVEALPWGVREQLTQEKSAVGFYLSGHLFDEMALEVRRFAKRPIEEVLETREPQVLAGIISGFKIINGNRGRVGIFTLDDKSAAIEATADENLLNSSSRSLLQDDTLVIVSGRLQPGRNGFSARFVVQQVWSMEQARCRFGKFLRVAVQLDGQQRAPDVQAMLREFPAEREMSEQGELVRGLSVRLQIHCATTDAEDIGGAVAELHLGESAKFMPSDAALASWRAQAFQGKAAIAYDLS